MPPNDGGRLLSVAPSAAMDLDSARRRSLSIGAKGRGQSEREYQLIACIAKGGMGEVFLGAAMERGQAPRPVIIKRLLEELRKDDDHIAMFQSEAEVMHRLDHPNIVKIIDAPIIDGTPCLAMEYIRGRSVGSLISRSMACNKSIPLGAVLYIMTRVLHGLAHVHDARLEDGSPLKLVHRDITPGNLLVSFEGDVKITDFGISKSQMSRVSTTVGIVKGKARYLSPEQILGDPATPRSDIFSCASVLVEMLTGEAMFERETVPKTLYAIVHGDFGELSDLLPVREPGLIDALERALSTEPKRRQGSAYELAAELEDVARTLKPATQQADVGAYLRTLFEGAEEPWESIEIGGLELDTATGNDTPSVLIGSPIAGVIPTDGDSTSDDRDATAAAQQTVRMDNDPVSEPMPIIEELDPDVHEDEEATLAVPKGKKMKKALIAVEVDADSALAQFTGSDSLLAVDQSSLAALEPETQVGRAAEARTEKPVVSKPEPPVVIRIPEKRENSWDEDTEDPMPPPPADVRRQLERTHASLTKRRPLVGNGPALFVAFALGTVTGVAATLLLYRAPTPIQPPAIEIASDDELDPFDDELDPLLEEDAPPAPDPVPIRTPVDGLPPATEVAGVAGGAEVASVADLKVGDAPPVMAPALLDIPYPTGARVRINGDLIEPRVPVVSLELAPGNYRIQVSKGRFKRTVTVELTPGEREELKFRRKKRRRRSR